MTTDEKIDGFPVKDGWLMRYDSKSGKWKRYMSVAEWEARKDSITQIEEASTLEEKQRLLEAGQKAARARRRKWAKRR